MTELEALRRFAERMLDNWPIGGVDGGELQEAAIECGLLVAHHVHAPCAEDCRCTEYYSADDWADGVTCYRRRT